MLKKWVGCNLALLATVLCFILFKLLVHYEYHGQILAGGVFFVIVYSVPFRACLKTYHWVNLKMEAM